MLAKMTLEEFAAVWNSSNSIAEVMDRTGYKYDSACSRRDRCIASGIELKSMARKYTVADDEFVRVWNDSSSIDEVMKKLEFPATSVKQKALQLREKGEKLKAFPHSFRRFNIYTAGVFDVSGTINQRQRWRKVEIQVRITDQSEAVILAIQEHFGGKIYRSDKSKAIIIEWYNYDEIRLLFEAIEPHLIAKKKEIREILEITKYNKGD